MQQRIQMLAQDIEKCHLVLTPPVPQTAGRQAPTCCFAGSCQSEIKRTLRQPLQLACEPARALFAGILRLHLPVMVNVSFHHASTYGFEMVDAQCQRRFRLRFRQSNIYAIGNDSNFTQI
jgi:hypothetical protein